ncbi:hypothetical protein AwDysgo_20790 [Bacteroidales bacterium]|nr:hypothetical protein AwDysgo_20790 [Bacteroidales bacterium]
MKADDDVFKKFQQSLVGIQGRFYILEASIPVEKQVDFFHFSEELRGIYAEDDLEFHKQRLLDISSSIEDKKYSMSFLAISGDVKSFRLLENYLQSCEPDLFDWLKLSILQAKITLESKFSDEKQVFISTGLGGKGDMLRFFSLFRSKQEILFSHYQVGLIEKEFPFFVEDKDGIIEELKVFDKYFTVLFLVKIDVDIKTMFDKALTECNQYGDFIRHSFTITNIKKYTDEEIREELKK